ncbi:UDP-N-acetylmuramoyl-L-alanyl-D-glutamate--2,6-diaminopimelate ligase [Paraglaciecola polaris]|uniref:UDP-N-acetylmuramyl-tripeptide synthetase n=1 Tax=Paraglaciecola polaris LMG 21857 TaxID=1129793 RepID=K7AA13_9ALTE|nr:UDP-N-acetylmuramoyl-L-alanyl-D-glutamate--2,6-diaminopimelate ligase [Paraglaciecola polaris]GAC32240.1 UDP-N-acetylmuramoylalanyl-D-glutamate--2,6-diaminopimelate ligase [Paraglaciecola polaris LMG 21857]
MPDNTHNKDLKAQSIKPLLAQFGIISADISIESLVLDSRYVAIHSAFIALKGHVRDGRDFIPQAISLGAKVIIAECDSQAEHGQTSMREQSLIVHFYALTEHLSALAAAFYGQPATQLQVIGVTGTNGKTSTVQLASQLSALMQKTSASIGTLGSGIIDQAGECSSFGETVNTTPDAITMHKLIAQFVDCGVKQVALEVSSHALIQQRVAALKMDVAVLTNLTRDHLDYHGTMQAYAQAKREILNQPGLKFAVVNGNENESKHWLAHLVPGVLPVVYGIDDQSLIVPRTAQYCLAQNLDYSNQGCRFTLVSSWGKCDIELALLGRFNIFNALAAITSQLCLGESLTDIAKVAHKLVPVAGRMERFSAENSPTVVVDYAHTPDALKQALLALRHHSEGRLLVIFGCGGDRDKGKRSLMGEVAETFADSVIITNDNSRSEDPAAIAQDILAGCIHPQQIKVILDRKDAIQQAILMATSKDIILVAGKGHEDYQIIGKQTFAYDERQYVQQMFERKTA